MFKPRGVPRALRPARVGVFLAAFKPKWTAARKAVSLSNVSTCDALSSGPVKKKKGMLPRPALIVNSPTVASWCFFLSMSRSIAIAHRAWGQKASSSFTLVAHRGSKWQDKPHHPTEEAEANECDFESQLMCLLQPIDCLTEPIQQKASLPILCQLHRSCSK